MAARTVDVFVRDKKGQPLPGVVIAFKKNGELAGTVPYAEGRARIELPDREISVGVSAAYGGETQSVDLAQNQDTYTFAFDVDPNPEKGGFMERHLALIVGLALFAIAIILAFSFGSPTPLQARIILGVFSLGGGAIATEISGMIYVDMKFGTKVAIGATGALAIFVILYLVLPA